jgi:hypothetical protein
MVYGLDSHLAEEFLWNSWVEELIDNYPDYIPDSFLNSELESKWLQKLYKRSPTVDFDEYGNFYECGDMTSQKASKLISRAYRLYCK